MADLQTTTWSADNVAATGTMLYRGASKWEVHKIRQIYAN